MTGGERVLRALGDNASLTKTVAEKDGKVTKKAGKWLDNSWLLDINLQVHHNFLVLYRSILSCFIDYCFLHPLRGEGA